MLPGLRKTVLVFGIDRNAVREFNVLSPNGEPERILYSNLVFDITHRQTNSLPHSFLNWKWECDPYNRIGKVDF